MTHTGLAETVKSGPGKGWPRVAGYCPACGASSLFVGSGGYITCSIIGCSDPGAVADFLDDRNRARLIINAVA